MGWKMIYPGRYRREKAGFVLEVSRHDGVWYWSTWKEDVFYNSGTAKKLRSGKVIASGQMTRFNKDHESKYSTIMKKNKAVYVLTISEFFPKGHPREGQETDFVKFISRWGKIHTIRNNYELWAKRAEKINKGEAVLSIRCWTGKPYNSKQRQVFLLTKIIVEKIQLDPFLGWFINDIDSDFTLNDFARNDGLSVEDFKAWFKGDGFAEPKAIIHFTDFGYNLLPINQPPCSE